MAFYLFVHNTLIKGQKDSDENYTPSQGVPISISGNNVYSGDASAYFVWKLPWFEFGRDQIQWGPGFRSSLVISSNNPKMDFTVRS